MPNFSGGPRNGNRGGGEHPSERPRSTGVQWELDPNFEERKQKMLKRAGELKCVEAVQVMLSMVAATDYFTNTRHLYLGPREEDVQQYLRFFSPDERAQVEQRKIKAYQRYIYGESEPTEAEVVSERQRHLEQAEREARQQAWRQVNEKYRAFDTQDGRGRSDWVRAMNVFKEALVPGEGIPGVLEVAPPEPGKEDARWKKFKKWCDERYVGCMTLSRVAQRLKTELNVRAADAQELKTKIEQMDLHKVDQVLLAGFDQPNDLYVSDSGLFKTLDGAIVDLDPEQNSKNFDQASAKAMRALQDAARKQGIYIDRNGIAHVKGNTWQEQQYRALRRDVYERVFAEESAKLQREELGLEVSNQSAAFEYGEPVAAIIARKGKMFDERQQRERPLAHGIHPVSPMLVRAIVGEERIKERAFPMRFDGRTGTIAIHKEFRLMDLYRGTLLGQETERQTGEKAVEMFVDALFSEESRDFLRNALAFHEDNVFFLGDLGLAGSIYHRAHGALSMKNFDLKAWYLERFKRHNICSVAEANAHATELTLTLQDVYPDQVELIAQIERDYPLSITIDGTKYFVEYYYVPAHEERYPDRWVQESFQAVIKISYSKRKDILSWKQELIAVGPQEKPLKVVINIPGGFLESGTASTNVVYLQELVDEEFLNQEWKKYPNVNFKQTIPFNHTQPLPMAREIVTETFPAYAVAKNGREKFPIPVIDFRHPDFCVVLAPTMKRAQEIEGRARRIFKEKSEHAEKMAEIDSELIERYEVLSSAIHERLKGYSYEENFFYRARSQAIHSLLQAARNLAYEQYRFDGAIHELEKIPKILDEVDQCARAFAEARVLLDDLCKIDRTPDYTRRTTYAVLDPACYLVKPRNEYEKVPTPPTLAELEVLKEKIHRSIVSIHEANERSAAWKREYDRRSALGPEERRREIEPLKQEIAEFWRQINVQLGRKPKYKFQESDYIRLQGDAQRYAEPLKEDDIHGWHERRDALQHFLVTARETMDRMTR